jgi:hypothetical protein
MHNYRYRVLLHDFSHWHFIHVVSLHPIQKVRDAPGIGKGTFEDHNFVAAVKQGLQEMAAKKACGSGK